MDSKTQLRIFVFLERLWLCAAVLGLILTVYFLVRNDNDSAIFFLGFFVLSALFYLLRRRQRTRYQSRVGNG